MMKRFLVSIAVIAYAMTGMNLPAQPRYWWTEVAFNQGLNSGAECADERNCMIAGGLGIGIESHVAKSTDGGRTWRKVLVDTGSRDPLRWPLRFLGIGYGDADHAIVAADSGYIIRTSDGGGTWTRQRVVETADPTNYISMWDGQHAAIGIGYPARLFVTEDGGVTWTAPAESGYRPMPRLANWTFDDLTHAGPRSIILTYRDSIGHLFVRSDDGGASWFMVENPIDYRGSQRTMRVFFTDSLYGWGGSWQRTNDGTPSPWLLAKTTDGGRTWRTLLDSAVGYPIADIAFADRTNGVILSSRRFHRTTDGGETWTIDSMNITRPIDHLEFERGHPGLAVSFADGIYLYQPMPLSTIVDATTASTGITIAPNPTSGMASLSVPWRDRGGAVIIRVSDPAGRMLLEQTRTLPGGGGNVRIDLTGLAAGPYFVTVSDDGGTRTFPIVVAR